MKGWWVIVRLFVLLLLVAAGSIASGQVGNRPFVKKFELGYPGYSNLNSIWPASGGYWGLMTTIDSTSNGQYYYGAEVLRLDSVFNLVSHQGYGDTAKYYFENYRGWIKSEPDGQGNFWYWLNGQTTADTTRHLYYGKMDGLGAILFERELPRVTEFDVFYDFQRLPQGGGVFTNEHAGSFWNYTWLTWVDENGNIVYQDSTQRINGNYFHETPFLTYDSTSNKLLAFSNDYIFTGFQIYGNRPRISIYEPTGSLVRRIDLTSQLSGNILLNLYAIKGEKGYVGLINRYIRDTTVHYGDHQPGIVRLDSSFNVLWTKYLFPPKTSNFSFAFKKAIDGGYLLAGRHDADTTGHVETLDWFITKFSPELDSLWTRFYNLGGDSVHSIYQDPTQLHILSDGTILVLVDNSGPGINYTTLYKLDSLGCLIGGCAIGDTVTIPPDTVWWQKPPLDQPLTGLGGQLVAFPNPSADGIFNLVWDVDPGDRGYLRITDVAGRVLHEQEIWRENRASRLDLRDWAAGTYLVQITSERGRVFRTKLCIVN